MRRVSSLLLITVAFAGPAVADVYYIDPFNPKPPVEIQLGAAEAARLRALQSAVYTWFQGDLSPDDRAVLVYDASRGLSFLDVRTGGKSPVSNDLFPIEWLTERRWLDPQTAVLLGAPSDYSALWLVKIDRATGAVTTQALDLPGFPISLSVTGRKALLVRTVVRQPSRESAPGARALERAAPGAPPVRTIPLAPRFLKSRTAPFFEAEEKLRAHVALVELEPSCTTCSRRRSRCSSRSRRTPASPEWPGRRTTRGSRSCAGSSPTTREGEESRTTTPASWTRSAGSGPPRTRSSPRTPWTSSTCGGGR